MSIPTLAKFGEEISHLWDQISEEDGKSFCLRYIIESNMERHRKVWLSVKEVNITENVKDTIILWFIIDQDGTNSSVDRVYDVEVGCNDGLRNGVYRYLKEHPGTLSCFFMDINPKINDSLLQHSLQLKNIPRLVFDHNSCWWRCIFENAFEHFQTAMAHDAAEGIANCGVDEMRQRWAEAVAQHKCALLAKQFLTAMNEDLSIQKKLMCIQKIKCARRQD